MRSLINAGARVAIGAIAVAGCSDPKAANEANFRKAIELGVRDRFCRNIEVDRMGLDEKRAAPWPVIVTAEPFKYADSEVRNGRDTLEQATKEGLLKRQTLTRPARHNGASEALTQQSLISYTPTSTGEGMFRVKDLRTASGYLPFPVLCPANGEVTRIVRWTDPADMFGQTITQVTYAYRGTDLSSLIPAGSRAGFETEKETTVALVGTNDGWQRMER